MRNSDATGENQVQSVTLVVGWFMDMLGVAECVNLRQEFFGK